MGRLIVIRSVYSFPQFLKFSESCEIVVPQDFTKYQVTLVHLCGEVFKTSYPVCKFESMSINIFLPQTPLCKYSQPKILYKQIIFSSGGGELFVSRKRMLYPNS